jgi:hypothetical protein
MPYEEYASAREVIKVETYEEFAQTLLDRIGETGPESDPVSVDLKVNVHRGEEAGGLEARRDCVCTYYGDGDIWICVGG